MQFKVQQYERCQTMAEGSIEDHLIGITKPTIDRLLKMDNPADCIALYTFYAYTRKWQKNSAVYATSDFAMKGLDWGRDRFSKAKAQLKESGFVEDVQRKDESGKVVGWYVGVRFAQNATLANFDVKQIENHPTDFPQGGSSTVWKNRTQIPITNTKIPITDNKIQTTSIEEEDLFSSIRIEENKPKKKKLAAIQKPDDVLEQVWDDFLQIRKAKKAPLTETALKRISNQAEIAGIDLEEALTICVTRGWQSFDADWIQSRQQQSEYPQRAC